MNKPGYCVILVMAVMFPLTLWGAEKKAILPEDGWVISGKPKRVTDKSSWLAHEGKRCVVKTTAPLEVAKAVAAYSDRYLQEFAKIFNAEFKIQERLTIRIFAHKEEYWAHYKHNFGEPERLPSALYYPRHRETWVRLDAKGNRRSLPLETVKHEFTHHMLHFFTGSDRLPTWFNEGTACFFQYWNIHDKRHTNIKENLERAETGHYGYMPSVIRTLYGTPRFPTVEQLVNLSHHEFHEGGGERETFHYCASWCLVNFLTTTKGGRRFFSMIVVAIREGKPLSELMTPALIQKLQKAWDKDIKKRILPSVKKRAPKGKETEDPKETRASHPDPASFVESVGIQL